MMNKSINFLNTLNEKQTLLLLIGISFGLRLYAVLMAQGIANDSAAYGFIARDFLRGDFIKGLSSPAPPFYPFLIYLFSPDTTYVEMAGRFISLFFGTLSIIPLFYLVKGAVGQREAIFSALLYSFHPYLVTYSGMLLTESTYWGLLTLSVYFFWTGLKKGKAWRMTLSGSFLGLAYLTRPEGIGYVLVYVIWILVNDGLKKGWFKKLIHLGVLTLTVFIFVVPYVIYIHQETGRWLITKKATGVQSQLLNWVEEKNDRSPETSPERIKAAEAPRTEEKGPTVLDMARKVARYIPFTTYHYLRAIHFSLWLFLFFGLIRVRQKVIPYELFLVSLVLFHLVSLSAITSSTIRFSTPVVPLSLLWAGAGILEIKSYFGKIKISNPEKRIFLLIVLIILIQLPQSLTPERRRRAEQKKVGLWLKKNTPPGAIIMSNSPQEAFYADREFVMIPLGIRFGGNPGKSYHETIREAKEKGVEYILINKNTHEINPGLVESVQSKDLKEIFRKEDQGLIIYEVIY
jgi:4-amino-4-deoxy-L-arabinose transferase-like glycosyltransferase